MIINGPNLNVLGKREPEIYGEQSFEEYLTHLRAEFSDVQIDYFQSNSEGKLIDAIQKADTGYNGLIINAAGYSHTSVAIADAVSAIKTSTLEVHISNIFKREQFRHYSYLSPVCVGIISGLGLTGYRLAVNFFTKNKKTGSDL
ncbi:MAG: type II 3-dehydroquinate dehydratase [Bacteroidota bacterium]|nr:type II 3-dehydroquinate dehydratase [Bacteroidota bacterium]